MMPKLSTPNRTDAVELSQPLVTLPVSPQEFLPRLIDAASSLGAIGPRLLPCRVLAYRDSLPPGLVGAYVTLLAGCDSLHIAVLADETGCVALARRMDCIGVLDAVSVRTRICDIARHLGMKSGQNAGSVHLAVSEPVFVDGVAWRTHDASLRAAEVVLGGTRATLVVVARQSDS
jgi:hypothetical protein